MTTRVIRTIFAVMTATGCLPAALGAPLPELAQRAAAVPFAAGARGLYDESDVRRTNTFAGLVPNGRWGRIDEALAGMKTNADARGLVESVADGYHRSPQLPRPLLGSAFTQVPEGSKLLIYERVETARPGVRSVRVLTPNAARVFLNGSQVWAQEKADPLARTESIDLRLEAGANQIVVEADPTPGVAFVTTTAAQRVGAFLAPLLANDPAAFVWFEPWLENPVGIDKGDPLDACLRAVGADALEELKTRGGATPQVYDRYMRELAARSTVAAKAKLVVEAAAHRRTMRLAELREKAPAVTYATHRDYRPSFFAYTEGLSDARAERHFHPGTSLGLLDLSGEKPTARTLVEDAHGMIRDPDVSYDGKRVLFAWKKSDRNDDFQLHEMDLESGNIRQITFGLGTANYEGAYLPDGTIVFSSTRDEHSVPCWITEVSNLYKINRDGSFLRRLAIDQVHSIYPKPTDDGRITYTRWDYSDRGQVFPHPLFQMAQDGTMQAELYGASSWFPNSLLHARQVPGTAKFLAIASGHHTPQAGKVVEIDTDKGRDEGEGIAMVAPRAEPEYERVDAAMQDGAQFCHPFPLDGHSFLVAHQGLGRPLRRFDLYWFDYDGGRELLLPAIGTQSVMYPVAVAPRSGHVRPERVDYASEESTIFIEDVYKGAGMAGIPRGTADRLRVVEVRYRSATVGHTDNQGEGGGSMNGSPIALAQGSWDVKAIVGETPIHPDGSVMATVPAMKSLYYQIVDKNGAVIQTMRTWDTNRPGEIKSCVGCHSYDRNDAPTSPGKLTMASRQPPAKLEPFEPTGWEGFSFVKHVQPIFNRSCVDCHNGANKNRIDLRGDVVDTDPVALRHWTRSYTQLTSATRRGNGGFSGDPDGPWVKWISKMSRPTTLPPYSAGAAKSPLVEMLRKGHHGVKLSEAEFRTLAAWVDLLVPFSGDYIEAANWDEGQRRFYAYYEDKRRLSKLEEHDEVRRYLEGVPAAAWHEGDLPDLEVAVERGGEQAFAARIEAAKIGDGANVKIPGPLRAGDRVAIRGASHLRIGLGPLADAEVFAPGKLFEWTVEDGADTVLPKELFSAAEIELRVKPLRAEERGAYRNLARNPLAPSVANDAVFPNVAASSETRNDPMFRARTAIDGIEENAGGHSEFPHQAWGPDKEDRPSMTVKFGRKVRIDRVDLLLRADFPHDEVWRRGELVADGRRIASVDLRKSADVQTVKFDPVECETLELRELEWAAPGWCALTELRVWGLDADRTPAARIAKKGEDGGLANVELQ